MPAPLNPPPTDEAGATSSPRQLNHWIDVNPVHPLTRTQTYLIVPSFNVAYKWKGYSELVASFNFTAGRNFSLSRFADLPSDPNYLLCVSWYDSSHTLRRYKIWSGVGEVLYFDVPLYTGQLIKKNFRFEVWSVDPGRILSLVLVGANDAATNQVYTFDSNNFSTDEYFGDGNRSLAHSFPLNKWYVAFENDIFFGAKYYEVLGSSPFGIWTAVGSGTDPAPYAYVNAIASQVGALNFYTSVRGNRDYMNDDDSALADSSAIVTNFSLASFNLPWIFPANSVSAVN